MTPEDLLDVVTADTVSIPALQEGIVGKHVAHTPAGLSIRSFVGGRFPRHRADDRDPLDREYAAMPEFTETV